MAYSLLVNLKFTFSILLGHPQMEFTIVRYHKNRNVLPGYT